MFESLTGLIEDLQLALPDFLTLAICTEPSDGNSFFIGLGDVFFPVDDDFTLQKVIGLFASLRGGYRYDLESAAFVKTKELANAELTRINVQRLEEILSNLGDGKTIFITKERWYCDALEVGLIYPIKGVFASDFFNYLTDLSIVVET